MLPVMREVRPSQAGSFQSLADVATMPKGRANTIINLGAISVLDDAVHSAGAMF
jgi:glutaminase